jgi:hypothetical protein
MLLGGAGGVLVFLVALPLALSNPFPTPRAGEWIIEKPAFNAQAAMARSRDPEPPDAQTERPLVMAALEEPGDQRLTFAERWNLRVPQAAISVAVAVQALGTAEAPAIEAPGAEAPGTQAPGTQAPGTQAPGTEIPEAALEAAPLHATTGAAPPHAGLGHAGPEATPERKPRAAPPARAAVIAPPPKRTAASIQDAVDQYLWEVYQRKPVKSDSTGDFTWKDQAAAKRLGISLRSYVIGGMDPDFREQLFHAGHAMDANGLHWSMLSAFRDDYRQGLAAGFKAHGGNSLHGGIRATGGYGHGRAIDIASAEGEGESIWHWIDSHGAKFGLLRPMTRIDPAHIQARNSFHDLAHELREARVKMEEKLGTKTKLATK